jgi:hypothetical protein
VWTIRSRAAAAIAAMTAIVVSWGAGAQSLAVQEGLHVLQDKCEFHANLAFREWFEYRKAEARFWDEDLERLTADYHSNYSTRLRHCLMLVEESALSKQGLARVSFIVDITEQREYAFYQADQNEVIVCELKPTVNQETFCKTRDEFDNFVTTYMDE